MTDRFVIETLWGVRKGESTPELMEAWDEYSIDQYREGWSEACQKAITSWGTDLDAYRYIQIVVNLNKIEQTFEASMVSGDVGNR